MKSSSSGIKKSSLTIKNKAPGETPEASLYSLIQPLINGDFRHDVGSALRVESDAVLDEGLGTREVPAVEPDAEQVSALAVEPDEGLGAEPDVDGVLGTAADAEPDVALGVDTAVGKDS